MLILAAAALAASPIKESMCVSPPARVVTDQSASGFGKVGIPVGGATIGASGNGESQTQAAVVLLDPVAYDIAWKMYTACLDLEAGRISSREYAERTRWLLQMPPPPGPLPQAAPVQTTPAPSAPTSASVAPPSPTPNPAAVANQTCPTLTVLDAATFRARSSEGRLIVNIQSSNEAVVYIGSLYLTVSADGQIAKRDGPTFLRPGGVVFSDAGGTYVDSRLSVDGNGWSYGYLAGSVLAVKDGVATRINVGGEPLLAGYHLTFGGRDLMLAIGGGPSLQSYTVRLFRIDSACN